MKSELWLSPSLLAGGILLACSTPVGAERGHSAAVTPPQAVALPLLLAKSAAAAIDPAGYLVSEKLDGVRAMWDGTTLRTRSGRTIAAPEWFLRHLPAQALDGELWLGRRRFDALCAIVRAGQPDATAWQGVRYMVFELPGQGGSFAQRSARIDALVRATGWPQLQAVAQILLPDRGALMHHLDSVIRGGGEGLMLHRADAPYFTGRSDFLQKLKPESDAEALVVGHRPGLGRHAGRLGALRVETSEGVRFWLGTGYSDAQRDDPPPIGSRVTYRFRDHTPGGVPRFASFVRRYDDF